MKAYVEAREVVDGPLEPYLECMCPFCGYRCTNAPESDFCEHFSAIVDEVDFTTWEFIKEENNG